MKRISLIISLVVLFTLSGTAQNGNFRIGLKLGPNFSWAGPCPEKTENHGAKLGFGAGVVADYYLTNIFAVSTGVEFNFSRMKYDFADYRKSDDFLVEEEVMVSRRLKTSNLEIPIKLKAKFNVAESFAAFVEAGLGLGFNLKDYAKDEYKLHWDDYHSEFYEDRTDQYRAFQPSMIFGLGGEYEINHKLSVFVQLSYHHTLSNAFTRALAVKTGSRLYNNYIGIEVGIMH